MPQHTADFTAITHSLRTDKLPNQSKMDSVKVSCFLLWVSVLGSGR